MEDTQRIALKVGAELEIPGNDPVVIIGPNGSGKTRLGVEMLSLNDAEMVAALRNIALTENVSMRAVEEATKDLDRLYSNRRTKHWQLSNEINQLFSKLMAEDSASAITFRDKHLNDEEIKLEPTKLIKPEATKLIKLRSLWDRLFPGRKISFAGHRPEVSSNCGNNSTCYSAQFMSDGERVALYLAARALDITKQVLIVDEPEVHFHSRLGVRFWNEIEDMRPEVRFVYITHDLAFALSRRNASYVILKSEGNPNLVELRDGIPRDLAASLLGAASFSIHAQRIVFCEGEEGKSLDHQVYSAWFGGADTTVHPVGSCRDVAETVGCFAGSKLIAGLEAIGVVDRDYWPDSYLSSLGSSIHVLSVHEIENLLCLEGIFTAIARHLAKPDASYAEFIRRAKANFEHKALTYQVSERFKCRVENEFLTARNALKPRASMSDTQQHYEKALNPTKWQTLPRTLFTDEKTFVENALDGSDTDFLRVFPGKVFFNEIEKCLGIARNAYVSVICHALNATEDPDNALHDLGKEIESALVPFLPPRKAVSETSAQ